MLGLEAEVETECECEDDDDEDTEPETHPSLPTGACSCGGIKTVSGQSVLSGRTMSDRGLCRFQTLLRVNIDILRRSVNILDDLVLLFNEYSHLRNNE